MRAWLMDSAEGVERLRLGEVADPRPGPTQVLLRMRVAALNPADAFLAQGDVSGQAAAAPYSRA